METESEEKNHTVEESCRVCKQTTELACTSCHAVFCSEECSTDGWRMHKDCVQIPKLSSKLTTNLNEESKNIENISTSEEKQIDFLQSLITQMKLTSSLSLNEPNEVIVVFIENETDFIVALGEAANDITVQIASIPNKNELSSLLNIESNNLAFVNHSGRWYRVKILEVEAKKRRVKVDFIDFGYTKVIEASTLKILPQPLEQIQPLAIKVRLANSTIIRESINVGDTIYLNVVGDQDGISLVTVENPTPERLPLEEELNIEQLLSKWDLDAALANKFDELGRLGLDSFDQLCKHEKNSNEQSVKPNSEDEEKNISLEEMCEKITKLQKQIKIAKIALISIRKESVIEEADYSNVLTFSIHCLGLFYKSIEYQHVLNMLVLSTYGKKFVETGINHQCLQDFCTILNSKLNKPIDKDSAPLSSKISSELNSFISFFNDSLLCPEHEAIHAASAVMLNFLNLAPFQPDTNQIIARLLFNLILHEKNFPMIIFPMERYDRLNNVSSKATNTAEYTEYLKFMYDCCISSLDFYLVPLKKGIRGK